MIATTDKAQAWNDYWRGQQGGCLPESSSSLDAAFREEWSRVAQALSRDARVLDLATGNAIVLRQLREFSPDLELIGVDLAEPLPQPPPGIIIHGGVAMEFLPFEDATFDAVVSQFGFEYGELNGCAAEAARVVRRGGTLSLVTHHSAGPIVAHNRARAAGLAWVLDEARLFDRARAASATADRQAVVDGRRIAIERHGAGSAGWQLAEAIARTVHNCASAPDRQALAMLDRLERMARGEMHRIAALEHASAAIAGERRLELLLADHAFGLIETHPVVHAPDGATIANFWSFIRR